MTDEGAQLMRSNSVLMGVVLPLLLSVSPLAAQSAPPKPIFRSELVTTSTADHAIKVEVDVHGQKQIFLVVDDGGNGFSHDWASWVEPRLIGPKGEVSLVDLKPIASNAGFGSVQMNKNCSGQPIRIAGKPYERGIGTHANSVIGFDLPAGFERFEAIAGLDNGGTDQAQGTNASVRFLIYSSAPYPIETISSDRDPNSAVAKLDVGEGLEATLFASEPELLSLTNLDIDHRGRVWVCEVVNYRGHNGERPEGDRILICSDMDGDGICDQTKVYYQGRDVDSAMGICVLGNKVIVSCSPNILVFTDEDGDDLPDRKELLFSQTGSIQHDHAAHSFLFGPDGKLYWNFGNEGHSVHDANGNSVTDLQGRAVNDRGQPFWGGMVFRCNLDGSDLEVLAHNFRNNYEATVDSYGTLWQSDNDDDGNRGVRLNYVMEYGNFGYLDELTGAGWQTERTGLESDIPRRHWHQDDPGVVPNLLVTGAGSPTGITVYEGTLLPNRFWNQVIHCDAGPSIVRSYSVVAQGAGFDVQQVNNVLEGARDNWFRPADVCVAPDGSLFVTDWYDPGVGGHAMGDLKRGRLFRVAPPGCKYEIPTFDFDRPESAVEALKNPCNSVRYLAWTALHKSGKQAEPVLQRMANDPNPRLRARALWLLAEIEGHADATIGQAAADKDENIRCQAVRMARRYSATLGEWIARWIDDLSPAVRREMAIGLREYRGADAAKLWAQLANQYDAKDRWFLEALGIAAEGRWNEFLAAWMDQVADDWKSPAGVNLIWRSRADRTPELIGRLIEDPSTDSATAMRLFRSLDFQDQKNRDAAMRALAQRAEQLAATNRKLSIESLLEIACRTPAFSGQEFPNLRAALVAYLNESSPVSEFVKLADRFRFPELENRLLETILTSIDRTEVGSATRTLLGMNGSDRLLKCIAESAEAQQVAVVIGLHWSGVSEARNLLEPLLPNPKMSALVRSEVVKALGKWPDGQRFVLQQVILGKIPEELRYPAANVLLTSEDSKIREEAAKYLMLPASAEHSPLSPLAQLVQRRGDVVRGQEVFANAGTCAKCHKVNGSGIEVGPDLSEVGSKLSIEALYESVLNPSAGISHNYEMYKLLLSDGRTLSGVLISRTVSEVVLKDKDAVVVNIPAGEIDELTQQSKSLMPDDLQKLLTEQQLVDVVEFMQTLRKR